MGVRGRRKSGKGIVDCPEDPPLYDGDALEGFAGEGLGDILLRYTEKMEDVGHAGLA